MGAIEGPFVEITMTCPECGMEFINCGDDESVIEQVQADFYAHMRFAHPWLDDEED